MLRMTHLNFVDTATPLLGWRIAALTLGAALLLSAGSAWVYQKKVSDLLEHQLAQAQPRIVLKPVGSAAELRGREAQVRGVADAVRQLNLPVAELLKALQAPKDVRVALLGLDLGGKGGADGTASLVKIEAEARTPQEMTAYVAFLGDQKLFRSVYLVKHEKNPLSPDKATRFLVEAQWLD